MAITSKKGLLNKKGFVYTTIVIVFLTIMISMFYSLEFYQSNKDDAIEARILTMNDFIEDLKVDTERAAYISGFRTLIALEEYITASGAFLDDLETSFIEGFVNGTIGNTTPQILNQSTFSLYISRVNAQTDSIDISMNMTVLQVNFSHYDPWNIEVDVLASVSIVDDKGLASWNFNETFSSVIPILDLKDPLYSVNTLGRLQNFVSMSNYSEFVVAGNTDNLREHITEGYYIASSDAPSFLKRFEGNLSSSPFGIESLVDISFLEDQEDITVSYDRSIVDYIYFGSGGTTDVCNVQNMPSWFRIDDNHLSEYEVNELTYSNCTG